MSIKYTIKPADLKSDIKKVSHKYLMLALFCLAIAIFLKLIGDDTPFTTNLIISLSVGFTIQTLISLVSPLVSERSALIQWLAIGFTLVIAVLIGLSLGFWLTGVSSSPHDELEHTMLLASVTIGIFFGSLAIWFFYTRAQLSEAESFALQLKLGNVSREKQLSEARLNLLQAQIEPHFLFNTLATVHSLIEQDPKRASSLLEEVNTYLRAALDHSRSKGCLLSHEIDLLRSYLDIMKIRMDERLSFDILVDEGVLKLPFPPMLLQPLVENAIKHGLEPKVNGGTLQISGMQKDDKLCLDVIDSGVGFADFKGEGIGLSSVRERLNTLYNGAASFDIIELGNRGVRASIQIPVNLL